MKHLKYNSDMIARLSDLLFRISNDVRGVGIHASMVQTQLEQAAKSQRELLDEMNNNIHDFVVRVATRGGKMTQEQLYPEGHPKRIEQASQRANTDARSPSKNQKKKKNDRTLHASSEPEVEKPPGNEVPISDAETQPGSEHSPSDNEKDNDEVHEDTQTIIKNHTMMLRQNLQLILITHNLRIKDMIKETLLLENMVRKENHGFKNLCPYLSQLKIKMIKSLNTLLKC